MTRTIVIGDIHGCLHELEELLNKLGITRDDRVICVGDILDKGPDPVGVLKLIQEYGFESVLGNHEEKHLRFHRHEVRRRVDQGYTNPMKPLREADLLANLSIDESGWRYLEQLPLLIQVGNFVVVHGGLLPNTTLDQHLGSARLRDKILRLRWVKDGRYVPVDYENLTDGPPRPGAEHWSVVYNGPHHVIYGHEPWSLSEPRTSRHQKGVGTCFGIDTGAVHGGRLTAAVIPEGADPDCVTYVQVPARKVYVKPLQAPKNHKATQLAV